MRLYKENRKPSPMPRSYETQSRELLNMEIGDLFRVVDFFAVLGTSAIQQE